MICTISGMKRAVAGFFRPTPHASRLTVSLALCALLASCGFHLRGQATLPFESLFVSGSPAVATQIARAVRAGSKTRVTSNPKEADATLEILGEARERAILSLTSGGRVRELQIRYRVSFRVFGKDAREYVARSEILLKRDLSSVKNRKKRCSTATCRTTPCSGSYAAWKLRAPTRTSRAPGNCCRVSCGNGLQSAHYHRKTPAPSQE